MNIETFKQKLFDTAIENNFTDAEIYVRHSNTFETRVFKQEVDSYKNSVITSVCFRGTYNGKMGYAFTEQIDESIIDNLVRDAKENTEILDEIEYINNVNESLEDIKISEPSDAKTKVEYAKQLEEKAYSINKDINVDYCVVGSTTTKIEISNTYGLSLKKQESVCFAYLGVRAKNGNIIKSKSKLYSGFDFDKLNIETLAKDAIDKTMSYLDQRPLQTNTYKVVIKNDAMKSLLSTFTSSLYAENVQKNISLFKGKLNTKVASDILTISDNGYCEDSLFSTKFDDEGVLTTDKQVIENGMLKHFLYNQSTAKKDDVKSTGNGFKSSYKSAVKTEPANFFINKGNTKVEDAYKKISNGILITDFAGLHAGANVISGDFSIACEGFFIEDGKITKAFSQAVVAGNFFELLTQIDMICDDLYFGLSSIGSPTVSVGMLKVASHD